MSKPNFIILLLAFCFSGLVYDQLPGLNFTLFTFFFTAALLFLYPHKVRERPWWMYAILANIAGICVFFVTTYLGVFATLVSIVALAGRTVTPQSTLFVSGAFAGLSIVLSPYNIIKESINYLNNAAGKKNSRKSIIAVLIALCAAIPFILLYRVSNPLFSRFVSNISIDWLDPQWSIFTIFSLFFVYGLCKTKPFNWVTSIEEKIYPDVQKAGHDSGSENIAIIGLVLFSVLNIMLLLMNVLDIHQLYISTRLPEGITLSEFVHEAITATTFSIIFAVAFIMFLFSGELNFTSKGRTVKLLVYAWIIQNCVVVLNTMVRNSWYINEYHLTELRIGVFIFLLLTIFGLALTWYKIARKKSAWWLFTCNTRVWFVFLVLSSTINWSCQITAYNIAKTSSGKKPDVGYLLTLGGNLSQMVNLSKTLPFSEKEKEILKTRITQNERRVRELQWPGYSIRMKRNEEAVRDYKSYYESAK